MPVKYLTVQEVTCTDPATFGVRLDPLMEALLRLEAADSAIEDPDLAADLGTGCVDVEMTVEAPERPQNRIANLTGTGWGCI